MKENDLKLTNSKKTLTFDKTALLVLIFNLIHEVLTLEY